MHELNSCSGGRVGCDSRCNRWRRLRLSAPQMQIKDDVKWTLRR
jgi:hypothetical protein